MSGSKVERQLILLSVATRARREAMRERAMQLAAAADWPRMTELLDSRRLLPTLGPNVLELAGPHASEEFATAVQRAIDSGRRQAALLALISERVRRALADAGIRSAGLKGPLLGEALYGDPGRRPSTDIDLLVARDQLHDAVEVVRPLGYAPPTDRVDDRGLPLLHFALAHERGELPSVELHWRVHWYESRFSSDRLLAPAGTLVERWRPHRVDELAALLLFYARDGFMGLRTAADVSAWWSAFGEELQVGALDRLLAGYPALGRVLPAAVRVAETVVGLPSAKIFVSGRRLGARGRIAVRLAKPDPRGSEAQLYAEMGLIDGLLAPPGGFRAFLGRQVMPPRETPDEQARAAPRKLRTSSDPSRAVRMLARYGLAIARLLRPPEAVHHRIARRRVGSGPDFMSRPPRLWRTGCRCPER